MKFTGTIRIAVFAEVTVQAENLQAAEAKLEKNQWDDLTVQPDTAQFDSHETLKEAV